MVQNLENILYVTKCKVLHLGKKNQQEIYLMHEHDKTILSSIENVAEHPDLGVLMDTSLSFNKYISPRGGAHKHFFDRDARPRTNFNYPKK